MSQEVAFFAARAHGMCLVDYHTLRFLSWGVVDIGWLPASFPSPRWVLNNPTVGSCLCWVQAMTLGDEVRPAIIIMGYKYGLLLLLVDSKMATDRCHKVGG